MKLIFLGPESHEQFVRHSLPNFTLIFATSEEQVDKSINDVEVIFDAYMKVPFNEKRLNAASKLKLFVTATTGASHIATNILEEKKIPLLTLKGQEHITMGLTAAAEHSWLLLMAVARQLPVALNETIGGGWDRNKFPGVMLKGKTIGIVGCGRIGEWVGKYATAFGMKVYGYDPYNSPNTNIFESMELDEMLSISDFISIHVPLLDSTIQLIDADRISKIKNGAIFVNTSRGEIVDENALLKALETNQLKGAGIDVITAEPYIENDPLILYSQKHNNLLITPHIGGFSPDALDVVLRFSCERINKFFND
jgi:phosphoglycerate dehydrogenase-like enzyme